MAKVRGYSYNKDGKKVEVKPHDRKNNPARNAPPVPTANDTPQVEGQLELPLETPTNEQKPSYKDLYERFSQEKENMFSNKTEKNMRALKQKLYFANKEGDEETVKRLAEQLANAHEKDPAEMLKLATKTQDYETLEKYAETNDTETRLSIAQKLAGAPDETIENLIISERKRGKDYSSEVDKVLNRQLENNSLKRQFEQETTPRERVRITTDSRLSTPTLKAMLKIEQQREEPNKNVTYALQSKIDDNGTIAHYDLLEDSFERKDFLKDPHLSPRVLWELYLKEKNREDDTYDEKLVKELEKRVGNNRQEVEKRLSLLGISLPNV